MAALADRGVPLSTLCPKFLHTNSTSHTWPFSAIAELIDNAYDPDVSAKQFWIDKAIFKGQECLSFMDNGNGLDHERIHKMLSFGYSEKVAVKEHKPIGMYGNGFKSGAMRIGRDAIVFSKSKSASCVGMLSQTYLQEICATQIIVPIVCFEKRGPNNLSVREEHKASLEDILRYSPFSTQEDLLVELNAISSWSTVKTGTRIIIWNLRRTSAGTTEFDFETDRYDIRIPSDVYETMNDASQSPGVKSYIPESVYSLRAYCTILYLKPQMQINIRGQNVKSQLIAKSLAYIRKDHYSPTFLNKRIPITFGYNTKSKDQYGIMMYHKNRLIKAYERVGCQIKASNKGVGVIGVIDCFFLEPTHNKQSFIETDTYRKTMASLVTKLEEYWKEIRHKRNTEDPDNTTPVEDTIKRPDQNWVQCDTCMHWRKLPDGIDCSKLPEKWFCYMNPNPQFRSCQAEQEAVDSDDDNGPSYRKTYKQQEREERKNEEKKRRKDEEDRKRQDEKRLADLAKQNKVAKQKCDNLIKQLHETQTVQSPFTPTTPRTRFKPQSLRGGASGAKSSSLRASIVSQAACSPSSNSGLPIISHVYSLSAVPLRGKRTQPDIPQTPKRPRVNGFHQGTPETSTSVDVSPPSFHSGPDDGGDDDETADDDDDVDDDDDTDDDIFILETGSTPIPNKPGYDLTKVKTERQQSDADVGVLPECSDDAAMETETGSAASAAVETSPSPARSPVMISSTTQTKVPKVKTEEGDQIPPEGEKRAGQSSHVDIAEQRVFKQNSCGDARSENQGKLTLQNGLTHHLDSTEDAGPSCANACNKISSPLHHPSMAEVQEQQDQLLELMQSTAQERDSFKEQVQTLTRQLQDTQSRLQEQPEVNVKKECSHQVSQTEETMGWRDYKLLFEKAKQKVNEMIKDNESLLAATETKPSSAQGEETDIDEIAQQVERLVRELDHRNTERDELRSQLDSLEEERANLASQCEELRLSLQQQRESAQEGNAAPPRAMVSSVKTDPDEARGTADTTKSLIELRHNVGRLLISVVPALDLGQVNYECNVIDEILEQVLSNAESVTTLGLIGRAINE